MSLHSQDEPILHEEVEQPGPRASVGTRIAIALGILVIGVVVLREGLSVRGDDLSPSGPRFMPVALGVLWLVLGVAHLIQVLRALRARSDGDDPTAPTAPEGIDHRIRLIALFGILIAFAYLLFPLGYVLSTALLFPAGAAALGSNRHVRDIVIGAAMAVALYLLFSNLLGISLPPGVLPL